MSMVTTLQAMSHHVWMACGDSMLGASQQQWGHPVASIGQGNGTGLQIWVAVCTSFFEIPCTNGSVSTLCCVVYQQALAIAGFTFVDNTDLCILGRPTLASCMAELMQDSITQ